MIECQSCGAKNTEGREFCRMCGDVLPIEKNGNNTEEKIDVAEMLKLEIKSETENLKSEIDSNAKKYSDDLKKLKEEIKALESTVEKNKSISEKNETSKSKEINNLIEKKLYAMEKSTNTLIESRFDRLNQNCMSDLQNEKEDRQREIDVLRQTISTLQSELNQKAKKNRNFFGDNVMYEDNLNVSVFSRWLAFVLCALFGVLGMHRFYVGKKVSAIIYILTLGALGIGVLVDLAMIAFGSFKDKDGLTLKL